MIIYEYMTTELGKFLNSQIFSFFYISKIIKEPLLLGHLYRLLKKHLFLKTIKNKFQIINSIFTTIYQIYKITIYTQFLNCK